MPITLVDQTAVVFIDTQGDLPVLVWTNIEARGYVPGAAWTFSKTPEAAGMWLWTGPRFNRKLAGEGWRRPTVRELVQLAELDVVAEHGWDVSPDLADDEPGLLARSVLPCTVTDDNDQPLYTLTVDAYSRVEPDRFPVHLSLTKDGPGNQSESVIYRPGFADEHAVAPPPRVEPPSDDCAVYCEKCPWQGGSLESYQEGLGNVCPACGDAFSITEGHRPEPPPCASQAVSGDDPDPTSASPADKTWQHLLEDDERHPMDPGC